jgi:hypothetical protein
VGWGVFSEMTSPVAMELEEGLKTLSHVAESSIELAGFSTIPKAVMMESGLTPSLSPVAKPAEEVIDLASSPIKKRAPWQGKIPIDPKHPQESPPWYSEVMAKKGRTNTSVKAMIQVENHLKKRFPKSLLMAPTLLEFLAKSSSDSDLSPTQHPKSILSNSYLTAAPLIWFSNIIYSQALLLNVASGLFTQPPHKTAGKGKKADKAPVMLWGMALPTQAVDKCDLTYQFWVIHLKGRNGNHFVAQQSTTQQDQFHKFESSLVEFFSNHQFDSMREDEESNIRDGLVSHCETTYIAYFDSAKQTVPTIVAAVQYSSCAEEAFIIWLCVSHELPMPETVTGTEPVCVFRRLGLGMFLQNLIQFQQVSRGWPPRLLLQAIVNGDAALYHINRGYVKSPSNAIVSVPQMTGSPFQDYHLHFISDKQQEQDDVQENLRLALYHRNGFVLTTYVDDHHQFYFLDGANIRCYPTKAQDILFRFPYNSKGSELETFMDDGSLLLFLYPPFIQGVDFVLPENRTG